MQTLTNEVRGWWIPGRTQPTAGAAVIQDALAAVRRPVVLVDWHGAVAVACDGEVVHTTRPPQVDAVPVRAYVPALGPDQLGDATFLAHHGLRYPGLAGAMAHGIASQAMVEAMARGGMLGFFGAAGLTLDRVEQALDALQSSLGDLPFGFNLIHSPQESGLEDRIVDLYLRRGLRRVCASAFLDLTLPIVRYRTSGIHRDAHGVIVAPNQVLAKLSRVEMARKFFAPPPAEMLAALVAQGALTEEQAALAALLPVAQDVTAEADSGGHTDNRPALALIPAIIAVRDEMLQKHEYNVPLRVGAAGGIGTPAAAAAAFAMGAAYVMTGSVNQSCLEAGTSPAVRDMLSHISAADVTMAPAADMFEMGVKVQVLKWGTMFPVRARKLYELYRAYDRLEALPEAERKILERDYFRCTLEEEWDNTRAFFAMRDPRQIERAAADPHHRMALVFRSYLGRSATWAQAGEPTRKVDYQIWCGPALGAFNEWVRGSFLAPVDERRVDTVAMNLLFGAAVLTRVSWLRCQGVALPPAAQRFSPLRPDTIAALLRIQE